jgi:outer membrane protein TolC
MRRSWIFSFFFLAALSAGAQEKTVRVNDLVRTALERNPGLKALSHAAEAQKFRIAPARALPDPVFSFGVKNMGIDRWTVGREVMSGVGISLSQAVPFPGKLRLRSEMAARQALQADESLRAGRLALVREVKELHAELFYYLKAKDFLAQKKEILQNALKTAEAKYAVGSAAQTDIFKAQVELSGIEEMLLTMDAMARATEANLNGLLDFPSDQPLGVPEEIPLTALSLELKKIQQEAAENSPLLRGAELMIEESSLGVEMAKKEYYPNFMVQAGKDFKGALPDMYEIMIGVEIPLFYKKKQANLLEESVSRLSGSKEDLSSMKNEVNARLGEIFVMAKNAENLIALYKERIIPQTSLALESSMANYQVNKVDFLMLLSDINALISSRMEYVKNQTALWTAAAKIEELTAAETVK